MPARSSRPLRPGASGSPPGEAHDRPDRLHAPADRHRHRRGRGVLPHGPRLRADLQGLQRGQLRAGRAGALRRLRGVGGHPEGAPAPLRGSPADARGGHPARSHHRARRAAAPHRRAHHLGDHGHLRVRQRDPRRAEHDLGERHAAVSRAVLPAAIPPGPGARVARAPMELRGRSRPTRRVLDLLSLLEDRHGHARDGRQPAGSPVAGGEREVDLRALVVHRHGGLHAGRHHPGQRQGRGGLLSGRSRAQGLPGGDPGRPRQHHGRHHRRHHDWRAGEPRRRLPRSRPGRRGQGGGALRGPGVESAYPGLWLLRQGADRAGVAMQCGGFRVTYRSDERIFDTAVPIVGLVILCAALALVPCFATTYWLDTLNRIGIAIIGALGLNILVGYTGQISIGQAAFLAVGAYSTAILEAKLGLPFYLAIPTAALITAAIGLIFGIPSLRLRGLYLAIATLAAYFITTYAISHWEAMTNGVLGFNVPVATLFGLPLDTDARVFYLIFALVIPAILFTKNLFRTRVGRAFIAIRDRDVAASVMGVSLYRYTLLAFVISSSFACVAGGLIAHL